MPTLKPQIQGMEPRRGRLGARTQPCDCGEKRIIKGVWMCLGEKLEKKREPKLPKIFFSFLAK